MDYCLERYLRAKKTVDDRALNHQVRETVRARLPDPPSAVSVLEIGGGVGTMVERLVDQAILKCAQYTIVDIDPQLLAAVEANRERWANLDIDVRAEHCAIEDWLERPSTAAFDLIIAHAVLDVVNSDSVVSAITRRLAVGGTLWLTINFDGETIFDPPHPSDAPIIAAYHGSMDTRTRDGLVSGNSQSGRRLFGQISRAGGDILAAGSSDWVVFGRDGFYPDDERYFLQHILKFFEDELGGHPKLARDVVQWLEARRAQIETGELVYIAHQLDFAACRSDHSRTADAISPG